MYLRHEQLVFSPSDLTTYVESEFASWMEHFSKVAPDKIPETDDTDSMMGLLQEKGDRHEHDVLNALIAEGKNVADLTDSEDKVVSTIAAMKEGCDIIFQGCLEKAPFKGYSDFLIKVSGESKLGDYHYEVWDTKLSKTVKPYFVIQLCCYEEMLQDIQGRRSDGIVVVLGNGVHERLRTDDYYFYYLSVKDAFILLHEQFDSNERPNPADSKSWGQWESYAKQLLLDADHLSQVATMSRSQIKKLEQANIKTMQDLVDSSIDRAPGINNAVYERLKAQAAIQKSSTGKDVPDFRILPHEPGKKQGLTLLAPHSSLDVFFDIEGYPLIDGGLEYLWGNTYFDEKGERQFIDFWAHDADQEKQCFEDFITWVYARWQKDPSMHIYHYANYEIAACRKLMGRYGVCEYEVDQLLRNEVFVDLYKVVKGAMLIGGLNYSIKSVELLYRGKRQTEVGNGGDSVVVYEGWRETPDGDTWETSKILKDIRDYNIDDCDSTQELVDWLRERQKENGIDYVGKVDVVEPELAEEVTERTRLRDELLKKAEVLKEGIEIDQATLHENLAWMLEFHRREAKPVFWRLFDRLGLSHVELIEDLDCLACCERTETAPYKLTPRKRNHCFEYSFDSNQEFKFGTAKTFYLLGEETEDGKRPKVTLVTDRSDMQSGVLTVECKEEPPFIISLVPDEYVRPDPIPQSITAVVDAFANQGKRDLAILDFLERKRPRIKGLKEGEPIVKSDKPLEDIINAVLNLEHSYLPIQGPPGAGKTYTGKHVIAELLKRGMKIGICSNSHKAINNLLIGTAQYCKDNKINGFFGCSKNTDDELELLGVTVVDNTKLAGHLAQPCVIGTTVWGFSREDYADQFDYLFIDEAGQVSVANLIAISRAATNLVLMGDQMQLGQPAQGSHPLDSGLSTLDYLLHHSPTISDDRGVFLGTTYRMHSAINDFISHAIYEGKLQSNSDNDNQIIKVPDNYDGPLDKEAGIIYVPVEHEGNTQASEEEVEVIAALAKELIGRKFFDKAGKEQVITMQDILFVAPYNHQVNKLKEVLGTEAKVGSVDKFQGQEAPIVFLSMCASDANESPRGMDFLFDVNRLNVAISRAQTLAIVVANPALRKGNPGSVEQQKKINLYCQLTQS
jgi:uncharacterized protein